MNIRKYHNDLSDAWLYLRNIQFLSATETAKILNIDKGIVNKFEKKKVFPRPETLKRMVSLMEEWNKALPKDKQIIIPSLQFAQNSNVTITVNLNISFSSLEEFKQDLQNLVDKYS